MTQIGQLQRASQYSGRVAVVDEKGEWTYAQLLSAARNVASGLLKDKDDLQEGRVSFLAPPGFDYVALLWGIWAAGGIAVPVGLHDPRQEIDCLLEDCEAELLVSTDSLQDRVAAVAARRHIPCVTFHQLCAVRGSRLPDLALDRRAMILYTSGTTSKPKGVVTTHGNIAAQVSSLVQAWEWTSDDRILNPLPLNHVHGIINVVSCALWVGATCSTMRSFDSSRVFQVLSQGRCSLFMAVPTIYAKLIEEWTRSGETEKKRFSEACSGMRLMVSGSAALPVRVLEQWKTITGHTLLERYGMTETGMILSNPLHGPRKPGFVGLPLPGVQVKLVGDRGETIEKESAPGEIFVRGDTVFKEYWRRPQATIDAFQDGWFKTGDIAVRAGASYRIQGRSSVDILKVGGYKVSALEIEEVLREHPKIQECAVVGTPDEVWGERVSAAVVPRTGACLQLPELREWALEKLARQKVPTRLKLVDGLPRNSLGKVVKSAVRQLFEVPSDG